MSILPVSQQRRQARIDKGQEAAYVDGVVREYVERQMREVGQRIIAAYRTPDMVDNSVTFYGLAAELTALDTLLKTLQTEQRLGVVAFGKEVADGTQAG